MGGLPMDDDLVILRRGWNDPLTATARLCDLHDVRLVNHAGGVCAPVPRGIIQARVWCDHLRDGDALHPCNPATAPHELDLCVLTLDNPPATYEAVRRRRAK